MTQARRAQLLLSLPLAFGFISCAASSQTCPSDATLVGNYTVTYSTIDDGDTCIVTELADGGPANNDLITAPSSSTFTLCASGADGGTVSVYLSGTQLGSPDASTYAITGTQADVTGSACLCGIDISDALQITFVTPDGGSLGFVDGGAPSVPSFAGRLDYSVAHDASDSSACACNVPCGAHYSLAGVLQ